MSTEQSDHHVIISSVFPSAVSDREVRVQWTEWPGVEPRIYPTPCDAASALGWTEAYTNAVVNNPSEWHTSTAIDYDTIGKQSIQASSAPPEPASSKPGQISGVSNARRAKPVFVRLTDWHEDLITLRGTQHPLHPSVTEFKSNVEASLYGCDTAAFPGSLAGRYKVSYSKNEEITVVASKSLESCLGQGLTVSRRKPRSALYKIWEAKAGGAKSSDARSSGDYTTSGGDNTISGGGYIEGEVED